MTIPSTLSNVLIDGNTFDSGASTNGVTTTNFTYNTLIVSDAGARITNNYFSGIQSDPTDTYMLNLIGSSNNIMSNTFVRGSSNILAYIRNVGSDDQMITNNIFDGYTVDGASNALVSGLTANSLYTNNKNQVGYTVIPLATEKTAVYAFDSGIVSSAIALYNWENFTSSSGVLTSLGVNDAGVTSGYIYDNYVLKLYDVETVPTQQHFALAIDISKSIPIGAKIIDVKISVYNPSTTLFDTSASNQFNLSLNISRGHAAAIDVKTYVSSGKTSWGINFNSNSQLLVTSGNALSSNYQVLEIPTLNFTGNTTNSSGTTVPVTNSDISSNYVNGNDYNIMANLNFYYQSAGGGDASAVIPMVIISPLIITYVF